MVIPINNHILIEPCKYNSFLSSEKTTYEEVGVVVELGDEHFSGLNTSGVSLQKGDKVFFDSWLSAKYPTGKGNEFFWLVRFSDIRAIEKNGN